MEVYVVMGGCVDDEHIIAIYRNQKKAERRAAMENAQCKGLEAYVEPWPVSK